MNSSVKKIGCAVLSTVLGVSMMPIHIYAQNNYPTEKEETVFTVLNQDGSVDSSIVSSWIHDEDGIINISEQLNLKNVENVKSDEQPSVQNNTYTWNVKGNDVFYQGESNLPLPVQFSIEYTLDGQPITAKQLEGKSGHLQVKIHTTSMYSKVVNGITIHPTFVLGGAIVLEDGIIENVKSDQGKVIDDGNRKVFVFGTVPGLSETLQQAGLNQISVSDDIEWQADVHDYSVSEMMMAMSNEMSLKDIPNIDTSSLINGVSALYTASEQLLDGSEQLHEGTSLFKEEIQPLKQVPGQMDTLAQGIIQLNHGSHVLKDSTEQYIKGVHTLYEGSQKLYGIHDSMDLICQKDQSLVSGTAQLELGLGLLENNLESIDISAMEKQLQSLKQMIVKDKKVIESMQTALDGVQKQMPQIQSCVESLQSELVKMNEVVVKNNQKIEASHAQWQKAIQSMDVCIASLEQLEPSPEVLDSIALLQSQKEQLQALQNLPELETFDGSILQMQTNGLEKSLDTLVKTLNDSSKALDALDADLKSASKALDAFTKLPDAKTFMKLKQSVHQLHAGSVQVKDGMLVLDTSLQQLKSQSKAGIDSVSQGAFQLDGKGSELFAGSVQVDDGMNQLASSLSSLEDLKAGLAQIDEAVEALDEGSLKLYKGQKEFKESGMNVLKEKLDLTSQELETLMSLIREMDAFNEEVKVFAGTPEGSIHTSRFVFKIK